MNYPSLPHFYKRTLSLTEQDSGKVNMSKCCKTSCLVFKTALSKINDIILYYCNKHSGAFLSSWLLDKVALTRDRGLIPNSSPVHFLAISFNTSHCFDLFTVFKNHLISARKLYMKRNNSKSTLLKQGA